MQSNRGQELVVVGVAAGVRPLRRVDRRQQARPPVQDHVGHVRQHAGATAEAPAQLGATPYFVDVIGDSFNIDPNSAEAGIADARQRGLNPRALIAVDLFGQPAEYRALREVAERHGLVLIADAAQSFGATYENDAVGRLADYTTTSFFPAK
ncbi:MAG: DegT/DnrJ/EryC1/StrS family aminotransferase, partial [Actinobacteria bacterium]|nr:DegT/DnrJ/EryC1/StrS family aminotransferase [Actinomycetota bacterium]